MALSKADLRSIKTIMEITFDEKAEHFVTKDDLKYLPSKQEFYSKMDEVMGELKIIREGQEILVPKVYNLDKRVTALEEIHPSGGHAS